MSGAQDTSGAYLNEPQGEAKISREDMPEGRLERHFVYGEMTLIFPLGGWKKSWHFLYVTEAIPEVGRGRLRICVHPPRLRRPNLPHRAMRMHFEPL